MRGKLALAYTAGIIDGEGHIGLSPRKQQNRDGGERSFGLRVDVGSTDEWLCQWLKMQYGGSVICVPPKKPQHSPAWRWYISSKEALCFLELILPYLQLKRQQAEVGIAFQKEKRRNPRGRRLRPMESALEEAQYILLRKLNRKGPSDEQRTSQKTTD